MALFFSRYGSCSIRVFGHDENNITTVTAAQKKEKSKRTVADRSPLLEVDNTPFRQHSAQGRPFCGAVQPYPTQLDVKAAAPSGLTCSVFHLF